jgi:hypothetical protein
VSQARTDAMRRVRDRQRQMKEDIVIAQAYEQAIEERRSQHEERMRQRSLNIQKMVKKRLKENPPDDDDGNDGKMDAETKRKYLAKIAAADKADKARRLKAVQERKEREEKDTERRIIELASRRKVKMDAAKATHQRRLWEKDKKAKEDKQRAEEQRAEHLLQVEEDLLYNTKADDAVKAAKKRLQQRAAEKHLANAKATEIKHEHTHNKALEMAKQLRLKSAAGTARSTESERVPSPPSELKEARSPEEQAAEVGAPAGVEALPRLLFDHDLGQYAPLFNSQGLTMNDFVQLVPSDFEVLGVEDGQDMHQMLSLWRACNGYTDDDDGGIDGHSDDDSYDDDDEDDQYDEDDSSHPGGDTDDSKLDTIDSAWNKMQQAVTAATFGSTHPSVNAASDSACLHQSAHSQQSRRTLPQKIMEETDLVELDLSGTPVPCVVERENEPGQFELFLPLPTASSIQDYSLAEMSSRLRDHTASVETNDDHCASSRPPHHANPYDTAYQQPASRNRDQPTTALQKKRVNPYTQKTTVIAEGKAEQNKKGGPSRNPSSATKGRKATGERKKVDAKLKARQQRAENIYADVTKETKSTGADKRDRNSATTTNDARTIENRKEEQGGRSYESVDVDEYWGQDDENTNFYDQLEEAMNDAHQYQVDDVEAHMTMEAMTADRVRAEMERVRLEMETDTDMDFSQLEREQEQRADEVLDATGQWARELYCHPMDASVRDVGVLLQRTGLGHYAQPFAEFGVHGNVLGSLGEDDLRDLGVDNDADLYRFLTVFEILKAAGT